MFTGVGESVNEAMRVYDSVLTAAHFNPTSSRLVLSFAAKKYFSVLDLAAEQSSEMLYWRLPALVNLGTPLVLASDMDKLLVGYDSNHIALFDLLNRQVHPWTIENIDSLPRNFLSRYNKFAGVAQLTDSKYLLYTSYTFCVLDLTAQVPQAVETV